VQKNNQQPAVKMMTTTKMRGRAYIRRRLPHFVAASPQGRYSRLWADNGALRLDIVVWTYIGATVSNARDKGKDG
jgi:hypothetical protein